MPGEEERIEDVDYASSGVSLIEQNKVNREVKEKLRKLGINVEGLFGGAVDISSLKGRESVPIGIAGQSLLEDETSLDAGRNTAYFALQRASRLVIPVAMLDYYASPGMDQNIVDFVEGLATMGIEHKTPTIGGESAQMQETYKEGKRDAYVDVVYCGEKGTTVDIADLISGMERPLLCASADGTGTKTKIVRDPRDIIYHGFNDLAAIGVRPAAFKMYVAGNVPQEELEVIVEKSREICEALGITALEPTVEQKKGVYLEGEVDIAGTVVGIIDHKDMITGKDVKEGDVVVGFSTDCLMTNGYTMARKVCRMINDKNGWTYDTKHIPELPNSTERIELSKPHTFYTDILFGTEEAEGILSRFSGKVKATAHITGGGQKDNIKRMVPDGLCAVVEKEVFPLPPIVRFFNANKASMEKMYESYNMGVGFTVTVNANIADEVVKYVNENFAYRNPDLIREAAVIGKIEKSAGEQKFRWAA